MGSIPSLDANSSIAHSNANVPEASPGARLNVGVPVFSFTSRWFVSTLGLAYNILVCSVEGSSQSSNVDVLDVDSWRTAVSVPSLRDPSTTRCTVYGRAPTRPNICFRVRTILTGRPTSLAAIAASTTWDHADPFEPKAPPVKGARTRTFESGIPSVLATNRLTPYT